MSGCLEDDQVIYITIQKSSHFRRKINLLTETMTLGFDRDQKGKRSVSTSPVLLLSFYFQWVKGVQQ